MKDNFTHVCFVIDESGSMFNSIDDVKGGYRKIIEEQKANPVGECAVSMYTFNGGVNKHYTLKDVNEIDSELTYHVGGSTALNDAVGTAIDEVGKTLAAMKEEDRPCSNLIVIMTDGHENSSREYTLDRVREMIKHQTDKYNWTFMYLGADITSSDIADSLGVKYRAFSTKKSLDANYSALNSVITATRGASAADAVATMDFVACEYSKAVNDTFANERGIKLANVSE